MPVARWIRCNSGVQPAAEHVVIMRTAQPALSAKLHILYPARRTGQSRQLIGLRAEMLADQVLQDGRQIQLLLV